MSAATQEQKTQQPAYTVQMGEAGFSMNVKMLDPQGQEVMLTFRAPLASHAQQLVEHYNTNIQRMIDAGWQPLKAGVRASQSSEQSAGGAPTCPTHGATMRPGKHGGFYCPRKDGDNWCKQKAS